MRLATYEHSAEGLLGALERLRTDTGLRTRLDECSRQLQALGGKAAHGKARRNYTRYRLHAFDETPIQTRQLRSRIRTRAWVLPLHCAESDPDADDMLRIETGIDVAEIPQIPDKQARRHHQQ